MTSKSGLAAGIWAVAASAGSASGCISANGFYSARTVPPGRVEIAAGPSGHLQNDQDGSSAGFGSMVGVRVGVAKGVDVAAQLSAVQLRIDAKLRLLDADVFTLSVAPGVWTGALNLTTDFTSDLVGVYGVGGLVLATWSPDPRLAVTLFGGPEVAVLADDGTVGVLTRQGVGLRWWVVDQLAIHPELVWIADAERDFAVVDATVGVGFIIAPGRGG